MIVQEVTTITQNGTSFHVHTNAIIVNGAEAHIERRRL